MKVKRTMVLLIVWMGLMLLPCMNVWAEEGASTKDVYELIPRAASVVEELGDEGLEAFNDPKGEFKYKDAYVFVINCNNMTMAAHPAKQLVGTDLSASKDKNPDPAKVRLHAHEMCKLSKQPNGGWLEYYWNKLGSDEIARKVGFVIGAPGTTYAIVSSIYDSSSDVDALNDMVK